MSIMESNLSLATDIRGFYEHADILTKQEFIKVGFDSNLYYENGVYRTPTMLSCLHYKYLKMRIKTLFIMKKRDFLSEIPSGGAGGIRTLVQTWYKVSFLHA